MKRILFGALVLLIVAAAGVSAAGSSESSKSSDLFRGTWYGGSSNPDNAGYKYQYTFIPTGTDRWYATADGAYNPDTLGVAILTTWTGEVMKASEGYDIRLLAMTTNDPVDPPNELPIVHGIHGKIEPTADGGLTIKYDYWGKYAWGKTPFVDLPDSWMLKPGSGVITETIHRMPTDTQLPQ